MVIWVWEAVGYMILHGFRGERIEEADFADIGLSGCGSHGHSGDIV